MYLGDLVFKTDTISHIVKEINRLKNLMGH